MRSSELGAHSSRQLFAFLMSAAAAAEVFNLAPRYNKEKKRKVLLHILPPKNTCCRILCLPGHESLAPKLAPLLRADVAQSLATTKHKGVRFWPPNDLRRRSCRRVLTSSQAVAAAAVGSR